MKLIAVVEHFAHHNLKTSPNNMVNYIKYNRVIKPVNKEPGFEFIRKWRKSTDSYLKRTVGMTGYELPTFISELKVFASTAIRKSLVHFYNGDTNCKYFPLHKRENIVITTYHQPPDFFYNFFKKCEHIERLDGAIVTSNVLTDLLSKYLSRDRVFFLPLAVDTDLFKPSQESKSKDEKKICLCVGNWLRDWETLRELAKTFLEREDVEFHIITLPMNKKYFENLKNVKFYSGIPLDPYIKELHMADLLVIPFKSCTSNLAVLEAMASGLPIVTTDVGGIRDYTDESFTVLHKKGDYKAMADTIVDLLADPKQRQEMSLKAREHSLKFSWGIISERLKDIYRNFGATVS